MISTVAVDSTLNRLAEFPIPAGWGSDLFLLPDSCIRILCDHIRRYNIRSVLELGTGFGTTSCVIAACLQELGGGKLITIDRHLHEPINVRVLMEYLGVDQDCVEVVVDPAGYNWVLADALSSGLLPGGLASVDMCFIDGAHEWEPDALAFQLSKHFVRPGGWMIFDDLDFRLRSIEERLVDRMLSAEELDSFQIRMIFDLLVRRDRSFVDCHEFPSGRIGWARRLRPIYHPKGLTDRLRRLWQTG